MEKSRSAPSKLAIVGGGPRGLAALESLYGRLAEENLPNAFETLFFEAKELPGAGHVYNLDQPDTNWLNFSQRVLTLAGRDIIKCDGLNIPAFPSFHEWSGYKKSRDTGSVPDQFPLRSTLGKYLNERFNSIATILLENGFLEVVKAEVVETDWEGDGFRINTADGSMYRLDEMVLTIGHQPTEHSQQISNWIAYNTDHASVDLLTEPYPVANILNSHVLNSKKAVALRGFGLAMIDVMRALTIGLGGSFKTIDTSTQQLNYIKSGREPRKIVPFSLDGLPMSPKPLNSEIDGWFSPTPAEKEAFRNKISSVASDGSAPDYRFVIESIAPIIVRVYKGLDSKAISTILEDNELNAQIVAWLADGDYTQRLIVPKSNLPVKTLEAFIGMATGTSSISLDYCIGQVWRHCQPILYKSVSFSNLEDDIIADIIALDERLKRYSYGPPVQSLQQLLALIKAGVLDLDFVDNPDVSTTRKGWKLSTSGKKVYADIMVNTVLDPARLLEINSPIVRHLLEKSLVKPVHGKLGILTGMNACVQLPKEREAIPLAVLGRLSKGTIVGVDAVLQCFEDRADFWAKGVVERFSK